MVISVVQAAYKGLVWCMILLLPVVVFMVCGVTESIWKAMIHFAAECEEQASYFDTDNAFRHTVKRNREGLYANPYHSYPIPQ